ncbi:MarR family transcriptional regulator [Neptunomonas phycophila]|uniref:MarR family winged helix-turn-helix transcriptional regulator n=1 Tax=Neptunomonas TaxID=75687 RepID=UPI000948D0C0|nr:MULTISPECIES: MarR family transcriptional regulator [Neptunomonas]MBT3144178.1 MarR family transcriptional regulator [Neptunomonas phycophila]MDN2661116.1 MarR family transcriptional regulator [Neptunomonas sp. CHC150]MDO6782641.1 MarR family transcriptional regulator [Neptunomonas phycophila]QLE96915.1 MarR family transcriptional regulator [Neptunomonas phycophila]
MPSDTQRAKELYEAVNQLIRVHQFRDRDYICCHDVSVAQCYALETLVKRGPLRLQALADEMYLDKSTASRVVDSLLRKKYVLKTPDPSDQRAVQLSLTPEGEALYQTIHQDLVSEEALMIKDVPPEIVDGALTLIRQLTQAARNRLGP